MHQRTNHKYTIYSKTSNEAGLTFNYLNSQSIEAKELSSMIHLISTTLQQKYISLFYLFVFMLCSCFVLFCFVFLNLDVSHTHEMPLYIGSLLPPTCLPCCYEKQGPQQTRTSRCWLHAPRFSYF
jgi:hypothetical protein